MSDYGVDLDAAAERIAGDVEPAAQAPQAPPTTTDAPAQSQPQVDQGTTEASDSFTNIDPSTLDPSLVPLYRSMQGDYTRKAQEIAEQRRALDGLDPVEARGAVEFINSLNNDPDFAMQIHGELTQSLQRAGLTPAEASAEAARQVNEAASGESQASWEGGDIPPELLQRIERTEQFMQTYEEREQMRQVEAHISQQEAEVKSRFPEWDADDMESVYAHAFANGGDLLRGADAYVKEQARLAKRYLNGKQAVPAGQPRQGGMGHSPDAPPASLKQATAAAIERMRNSFAGD